MKGKFDVPGGTIEQRARRLSRRFPQLRATDARHYLAVGDALGRTLRTVTGRMPNLRTLLRVHRAAARAVELSGQNRREPAVNDITGRDDHIIAKALIYAVALIDSQPEARKEPSERSDMVALLVARVPDPAFRKRLALGVEARMGILPDMTDWKLGDE